MKLSLIGPIFFFVFGCGIKGDPLPPAETQTLQKQETIIPEKKPAPEKETVPKKKVKK